MEKNDKIKTDLLATQVALEEAFFQKDEKAIVNAMETQKVDQNNAILLSEISGIKDQTILGIAVQLGLTPHSFSVLNLVPLLKVAWADHKMDPKENKAILKVAVKELKLEKDGLAYKLLESWLSKEMNPNLFLVWKNYIHALKLAMSESEFSALKKELFSRCKKVAKASGGFMGIGNISEEERDVLDKIEKSFD